MSRFESVFHHRSFCGSLADTPTASPRPPDRCRGLAGEDQCQGWRLRHRVSDAPLGAPLTVIFARREDARRGGRPGQITQARSPGQRYGLSHRPAGAGQLTGVRRRARRASARQGAAGRRPTVRGWPTAPLLLAMVAFGLPVTHSPDDYALAAADPAQRAGRLARRRRALEAVEKVVTSQYEAQQAKCSRRKEGPGINASRSGLRIAIHISSTGDQPAWVGLTRPVGYGLTVHVSAQGGACLPFGVSRCSSTSRV